MTGHWWWPRGRVSRRALATLYLLPALVMYQFIDLLARFENDPEIVRTVALVCVWVWVWPLAVGIVKRLHDCGYSGLWAVVVPVPIVGVVVFWVVAFTAVGQADANRYGFPPIDFGDAPR